MGDEVNKNQNLESGEGESLPPGPPPAPEDELVSKAVFALTPVINQRFAEISDQIKGIPAPPTSEQMQAMIKSEVRNVINELMTPSDDDPPAAGVPAKTPGPIRPGGTDPLAMLMGLLQPKQSSMEQFQETLKLINASAQTQIEIFRSGSDFASGLISAAAKLGANPGSAADLVKERHPNIAVPENK